MYLSQCEHDILKFSFQFEALWLYSNVSSFLLMHLLLLYCFGSPFLKIDIIITIFQSSGTFRFYHALRIFLLTWIVPSGIALSICAGIDWFTTWPFPAFACLSRSFISSFVISHFCSGPVSYSYRMFSIWVFVNISFSSSSNSLKFFQHVPFFLSRLLHYSIQEFLIFIIRICNFEIKKSIFNYFLFETINFQSVYSFSVTNRPTSV